MPEEIKNSSPQVVAPVLLAIGVSIGILIGVFITRYNFPVDEIQNATKRYGRIMSIIENDYVDTVDVDQLFESSVVSMLDELDPHTSYIPVRDQKLVQSHLEGEFEGIGIEFSIIKDTLYVITAIGGGPSEQVGLKSGDRIVAVDDENIAGVEIETRDVFNLLRGPKGSEVKLTIKRNGHKELLDFVVTRAKIPTYSIDASYMIDDSTGYIKISRFAAKTYEEFNTAIVKLKREGLTRLILDLRDNGGGYMRTAVRIADELLAEDALIVYTDGKESRYKETHRAEFDGEFETGSVIVLINESSASASEILAGALQDNDRALIVGRRSYGKGLVQAPILLEDGAELRLTISRYYTPSGRCIQKDYNDLENYKNDYVNRYKNGELFFADSVEVVDSLKFKTTKGRIVYGGGGILPDDFVAKDTLGYTDLVGKLYAKNILREYALGYVNSEKERLEEIGISEFILNFKVSRRMFNDLMGLAEKSNIKIDSEQLEISRNKIKDDLKALIARGVWGNEGFYEVLNSQDVMIEKALELFPKARVIAEEELQN